MSPCWQNRPERPSVSGRDGIARQQVGAREDGFQDPYCGGQAWRHSTPCILPCERHVAPLVVYVVCACHELRLPDVRLLARQGPGRRLEFVQDGMLEQGPLGMQYRALCCDDRG